MVPQICAAEPRAEADRIGGTCRQAGSVGGSLSRPSVGMAEVEKTTMTSARNCAESYLRSIGPQDRGDQFLFEGKGRFVLVCFRSEK